MPGTNESTTYGAGSNAARPGDATFVKPSALPTFRKLTLPSSFSMPTLMPAFNVYESDQGYAIDLDFDALKPTGYATIYVDPIAGNDANPGTNPALPKRTLYDAAGVAGNKRIVARPGLYPYKRLSDAGVYASKPIYSLGNRNIATNCILEVWGGVGHVVSSMHIEGVAWTFSPANGWWTATFDDEVGSVADAKVLDSEGLYTPYEVVASQAAVTAPGMYHFGGGVLTVRTLDGRTPDNDLRCYLNTRNLRFVTDNLILWTDGWAFEGGAPPMHLSQAAAGQPSPQRCYVRNGWARYSTVLTSGTGFAATDTLRSRGDALTVCVNFQCDHGFTDGFDHDDAATGVGRTFLEIACSAYRNGRSTADDNNQGFTSHATSKGIRIGCLSRDSKGPNFHDVTGSQVLLIGCTGYKSRAAGTKNADFAVGVDGADASQVWLLDCASAEGEAPSAYAAYAFTSASGRLYERNFNRGRKPDTLSGVVGGYL